MIEAIKNRRAVREFLSDPVSDEKINEIVMAASCAPSANGIYPWQLVVIRDAGTKELLSKTTPWSTFASGAATIIAVIGNESESGEWIEDCSIVSEHIWLECAEQGLGACWIQIRNQGAAEADVRTILNIPEEYRVLCLMALGVPSVLPSSHDETAFDRSRVKYEKFK